MDFPKAFRGRGFLSPRPASFPNEYKGRRSRRKLSCMWIRCAVRSTSRTSCKPDSHAGCRCIPPCSAAASPTPRGRTHS